MREIHGLYSGKAGKHGVSLEQAGNRGRGCALLSVPQIPAWYSLWLRPNTSLTNSKILALTVGGKTIKLNFTSNWKWMSRWKYEINTQVTWFYLFFSFSYEIVVKEFMYNIVQVFGYVHEDQSKDSTFSCIVHDYLRFRIHAVFQMRVIKVLVCNQRLMSNFLSVVP